MRLMSKVAEFFGGSEDDFDTRDSHLAAALMAVGIRPVGAEPVRVVTRMTGPEQYQFYFNPVSECGKYRTRDLLKAWIEGVDWIEKNEEHPFAFAMACALNYAGLMRFVKRRNPIAYIKRGDSVALLPLNATARQEEEILGSFK